MYSKTFEGENYHILSEKWVFPVKFYCSIFIDLHILLIYKAMVYRKRFEIEYKTIKTAEVLPYTAFAVLYARY